MCVGGGGGGNSLSNVVFVVMEFNHQNSGLFDELCHSETSTYLQSYAGSCLIITQTVLSVQCNEETER